MKKKLKTREYADTAEAQNEFVVTEAYRLARTNIDFSVINAKCKVIMFTSPLQGDGKTTTAINIAGAFARKLDTRVLLIDCDLRKPRVSKYLHVKKSKGLTDYLCKTIEMDDIIVKTDIEGLSAVLSGTIPPNPSELLSSSRMEQFITEAKEKFDYIIIDTPPINIVADVLSICDLADGIVAVIREKKTTTKDIDTMLSSLSSRNVKLLGFIFNDVTVHKSSKYKTKYSRYKNYGYSGSYYSQNDTKDDS
ncbi:MAG: CpsD/CapB family tyrosine-protein kinase [Oscillospiraceae bacterium]